MKKLLLSGIILLVSFTGNSQIINHPQSIDGYGWGEKDNTNIIVSAGKYKEAYIVNYDLTNGNFTYLNENTTERLNNFVMIGDVGIASNGTSLLYTYDNWKTMQPSTTTNNFDKYIKTQTGFLGRKNVSTGYSEYYHSVDAVNWTLVKSANKGPIAEKNGKTWIIDTPKNFNISSNGGLTFINKIPSGAPLVYFTDFIPIDALSGIGIVSTSSWYYTNDGGDSWTKFNNFPSSATFIYAANLDAIYANFLSIGLLVSVDKGVTWQPSTLSMPENISSRLYSVGNKLVSQISWNGQFATYYSEGIGMPWTQLHKRIVRKSYNDINFYNNKGIVVGDAGTYCYTHDKGKTYNTAATTLGTQDLKACEIINESTILIGDRTSNIYVSNDAGLTWNKKYSNGLNWISRKFRASSDLATIVLFRNGQNLMSKDQGMSWSILGSLGGSFDGTVTPSGKILIISGDNILEMNRSSGSTSTINSFTEPDVQGTIMEMIDDNNGYVIATNGTDKTTVIYKTTDGWATYTKAGTINSLITEGPNPFVPSFTVGYSLSLNIIAPDKLYINRYHTSSVSYSNNTIYKSIDGGTTWLTETIVPFKQGGSTDKLQGMHYFGEETFISVWEDGRIVQNTSNNTPLSIVDNTFNKSNNQSVLVYPNPTPNIVNLQSEENIEELYLIDITGKMIHSEHLKSMNHQLNIAQLPSGIYFLKIKTENTIEIKKIIKQH